MVESKDNYYVFSSSFEKLYVYSKDNQYEVGDILSITGEKNELSFSHIESSFDFESYLNKKGVYHELKVVEINNKFLNPIRLKSIREKALEGLDNDTRTIVKGIIFSSLDDNDLANELKDLHLMRLLSTSGIYIALFYKAILFLFTLFFKEKTSKIISTIFIGGYTLLLFPKFSLIRFTTFLIFKLINEYILKKKLSYLSLLSITGIFFIIIDYHITYQISFILGYTIPIFSYFIFQATKRYTKNVQRLLSTLFLFIYLMPIDIYFYNEFSIFAYLFQLMLIPIFLLISIVAIFLIFKVPISPVMIHLINAVKNISKVLSFINLKIYVPPLNEFQLAIYIIIFIVMIYLIEIRLKPLIISLNIGYLSLMTLYFIPINNLVSNEVSFINVGQGDSCLIRKGTTTILIDTGGSIYQDIAKDSLIPYLKKKRIYNIDLLITTHDDYDHSGASASLISYFKVKQYVTEASLFPINVGGIELYNYNNYQDEYEEENDKSLVIEFNLHNVSYLIMGDAPKEVEYRMIEDYPFLDCDILKVGHHGSNTSSSEEFIKYVTPKEAIISCGKNNRYGHPHKEVIDLLNKNNIKIRRTDIEGTVTYYSYF